MTRAEASADLHPTRCVLNDDCGDSCHSGKNRRNKEFRAWNWVAGASPH